MNIFLKASRFIIRKTFAFSVQLIRFSNSSKRADLKLDELRNSPVGTLGYDVAKCLDNNNLKFVPHFESHDLKHVILEYKMTPADEIKLQAFMLGNGNYTLACFAILTFGIILLPDEWMTFYNEYKKGRKAIPISSWTIDELANTKTDFLRNQLYINSRYINNNQTFSMKTFVKYFAFASVVAGILGMLFCLPFLFSADIADLVGAGFPFIGGSILTVGGLLVLSNLARKNVSEVKTEV